MTLKNQTTGKIICSDLKICQSFTDSMLGLLLPSNPRNLLFRTHFGIHTFFLKEPVDILILTNKFQVIKVKQNLKPNKLFFWNPKYSLVIELLKGTIKKFNIQQGDFLKLVNLKS